MKLLVEVRIASSEVRDTKYIPVIVDANDGGEAQRKALEMAQKKYPNMRVSGGTVYNATEEAIADAEKRHGVKALTDEKARVKAKPAPVVGVPEKGEVESDG